MKKTIFTLGLVLLTIASTLTFTACFKTEWTCTCTSTNMVSQYTIQNKFKSQAKRECEDHQTNSSSGTTCVLK